jgi:hypothetical protein
MGESWHNSHHADPTCARHGVRRGQIDISARLIWIFEKLGWASKVRWPRPERLARKLKADSSPAEESLSQDAIERELRQRPEERWSGAKPSPTEIR